MAHSAGLEPAALGFEVLSNALSTLNQPKPYLSFRGDVAANTAGIEIIGVLEFALVPATSISDFHLHGA